MNTNTPICTVKAAMDKYFFYFKGCIADLHGRVVLKRLNYPISMLPILFRSVDRLVNKHENDPCRSCKFTISSFLRFNKLMLRKRLTKKRKIIFKSLVNSKSTD